MRVRDRAVAAGLFPVVVLLSLVGSVSCSRAPAEAAAPAQAQAPPVDTSAQDAPIPHGDHSPHHGGTVWMHKDVHFEVILDPGGHHRLYFSDAVRQDLPASVASHVVITVERPGLGREEITGTIDDQGESWRADGRPVSGKNVSARVAFGLKGESDYFIDLPFTIDAAAATE